MEHKGNKQFLNMFLYNKNFLRKINFIEYYLKRLLQKSGLALILFKIKGGEFYYKGKKLKYFYHNYNKTFFNERKIEIPIALNFLKNYKDKNILEVGNVLNHYINIKHEVVDKFEKGQKVINKDISTFKSTKKYDLIISISTFEHIGQREKDVDEKRLTKALENIGKLLSEEGEFLLTFPLNYNQYLDKLILNKGFDIIIYKYKDFYRIKRLVVVKLGKKDISNIK